MKNTKIKNLMCQDITLINQNLQLKKAKEIMRIKGITGIPVISREKKLVGIISISDIIKVLEEKGTKGLELPLEDVMTSSVISLNLDDSLSDAVFKFRKYGYGRLPVVDNHGNIKGMITPKEMIERMLDLINNNESGKTNRNYYDEEIVIEATNANEDQLNDKKYEKENDHINMSFNVLGGNFEKAGEASSEVKKRLKQIGLEQKILRRVAIVTYEAEMNVIIHAHKGVLMVTISTDYIKILVHDEGPGIQNVELAMTQGYSTAPSKVRELGFGAGMGLPNIKKFSDEFNINSEVGIGTKIKSVIYR